MEEYKRTHHCGELRISDVGKTVDVLGWVAKRRNFGNLLFIDLRDRWGLVQITVETNTIDVPDIRNEYVISVHGKVAKKDVPNKNLATGEIEIVAESIKVINTAQQPPIIIADDTDANEDIRLKYRYLDLRRLCMQKIYQIRAQIVRSTHQYLDDHEFIEVETPSLTLSSPEGAKEYLIPSRLHHGCFYALPQSPQIYKQLLMIGGFERYYQIAKCFRDEDLRADRQPDFTQIDIETSFLSEDQILTLAEGLVQKIFKDTINYDVKLPLRRINYDEAVEKYGSDKPDTRFDLLIENVKEVLQKGSCEFYNNANFIAAICVPKYAEHVSRKKIDELALLAQKFNMKSYGAFKCINGVVESSLTKFFTPEVLEELKHKMNANDGDAIFVASGANKKNVYFGLGALRSQLAKELGYIKPNTYDLLWVNKFPLFGQADDGSIVAEHHPFTRPCDEDVDKLLTEPEKVYSYAYDIVINGYEAGGGTLRIFDQETQKKIFTVLGFSDEDIRKKFGWFVDALQYGTPPHGGLAFGLDRLTMILSGTDNIRDVIAFPKNLNGVCPMTNAPREVSQEQLDELGLALKEE